MFDNRGNLRVASRDDLLTAILLNERAGAIGTAHLMRALHCGRIALLLPLPDFSSSDYKQFAKLTASCPSVALIGDDDGLNRGPGAWRIAARIVRWATTILVHGAGAELPHYEAAIKAAETGHRVLIVECGSTTLPDWVKFVSAAPQRPGVVAIYPRGGSHPVSAETRSVQ